MQIQIGPLVTKTLFRHNRRHAQFHENITIKNMERARFGELRS